jgi:DNA-binding CsgD family transcriptional regulator
MWPLSPKETLVLKLTAEGFTSDEIARQCFNSSETIKTHKRHIINKLGARNMVHAVAMYVTYLYSEDS